MRYADPAARVLVFLAVAVPVELDLDSAVLVGPDLFAGGPDHHGGLGPADLGLGGDPGRAKLLPSRLHGELAVVGGSLIARGLVGVILQLVLSAHDDVLALLIAAGSIAESEGAPDGDLAHIALELAPVEIRVELVDACARIAVAIIGLDVFTGVIEDLVV